MSFNLLKLKKLDSSVHQLEEVNVDHVIVGFTAKSIFDLANNHNFFDEKILIIDSTERSIEEHLNVTDALPYPWFSEGENVNNQKIISGAKFFKDGELRSFSSRHKLNTCHPYLEKFQHQRLNISWSFWWRNLLPTTVKEKLSNSLGVGQIKQISKEGECWVLQTFDHRKINAQRISWNLSPELFLKLFKYEKQYSKDFLNYCASHTSLNFLLLEFKMFEPAEISFENCLIPLTMGTDEGYFLLTKNINQPQQTINLLYVFDEQEVSEELITQKIKQMKKQLKKTLNLTEHALKDEKVWFLPAFSFVTTNTDGEIKDTNFLQSHQLFSYDPAFSVINTTKMAQDMLSLCEPENQQQHD